MSLQTLILIKRCPGLIFATCNCTKLCVHHFYSSKVNKKVVANYPGNCLTGNFLENYTQNKVQSLNKRQYNA